MEFAKLTHSRSRSRIRQEIPAITSGETMKPSSIKDKLGIHSKERRTFNRKAHSGFVFFAARKKLFEGELLNYSQGGLGIRVSEKFVEGENLIVALPFEDAKPAKCPARVVWCNGKGLGAKLVR
jgi:hypothetical protein